jgi:UDP-N-acetylglucosamine--N-acetylmuramyl-(pentapeptide) pyrophosphoryl-undecaprenol N-acetylglucosamine transferase
VTRRPTVLLAGGGSGGHLMPALAIAAALRAEAPELEPVLVGATRGVEARILPTRDWRYHLLPAEPIYRRQWWRNARWPFVAARLLRAVSRVYAEERPLAVVGTGGYASAPVVWWGATRGVPAAVQEQNAYPGLSTRWLSRRVREVYLGLPEAEPLLRLGHGTSVLLTGNPIVPPDPSRRPAALRAFGLDPARPVVLVTGGSQGARAINRAVAGWVHEGMDDQIQVLWVTGRGTHTEFAGYHRPPHLTVIDFLDPMADAYAVADVVVGRAGAITVAELCAWGLPSILVPLPTAAADHQTHNAQAMAAAGAAVMLPQGELSAQTLRAAVEGLLDQPAERERLGAAARARGRPDAAATIARRIATLALGDRAFAASRTILH